jgi:hypothetical protein
MEVSMDVGSLGIGVVSKGGEETAEVIGERGEALVAVDGVALDAQECGGGGGGVAGGEETGGAFLARGEVGIGGDGVEGGRERMGSFCRNRGAGRDGRLWNIWEIGGRGNGRGEMGSF